MSRASYAVPPPRNSKQAAQMVQTAQAMHAAQAQGQRGRRGRGQQVQMVPVATGRRGKGAVEMVPVPLPSRRGRGRFLFSGVFILAVCVAACVLILGALVERQASLDEAAPSDAIIVLGAAQWNGKPSPVLQARLDHAYDLWKQKTAPAIIVTGGTGEGDAFSESQVARQYLINRGVPAAAVLMEDRGRSSYESMVEAASLMSRRSWSRATIVSDPFHMLRLKRMGDDLGLRTFTSPTRSSPILPGSETEWFYKLREIGTLVIYLVAHR